VGFLMALLWKKLYKVKGTLRLIKMFLFKNIDMTTITLNIEDTSILKELKKVLNAMQIPFEEKKEKEIKYSDEFLNKLKKSRIEGQNGDLIRINPDNIWESI
jgi:ABC-type antimicrobial peptide transport system permease subunit